MARMRLVTYKDAIDHLVDYLGASTESSTERYARKAVLLAYNKLTNARRWTYHKQVGRLNTVASQTSSTITYDHTGGAHERMVTIASGTWPSWARLGTLVISSVPYEVSERKSSTVLTLSPSSNPGADVAAGTSYTLFQDTYALPIDFVAADAFYLLSTQGLIQHKDPSDWLLAQRDIQTGAPTICSITGNPDYQGAMALRLYPAPDAIYPIGYIYHRRPRQLNIAEYATGTTSITSGSTTVTGSGTSWTSSMVGSVMRFAASGVTDIPTGPGGTSPASIERVITAYTSATSLTVDTDPGSTISGGTYSISDPVDLEEGAMLEYFLRLCEEQMRMLKRTKPTAEEPQALREAEIKAYEADNRSFEPKAVGDWGGLVRRLSDYPTGEDAG